MPQSIRITAGAITLEAELNDSKTAAAIFSALPLNSSVQTWGEEIYFTIEVKVPLEKAFAKEVVALGDLGYWPQGRAFCIFFGATPVSTADEIRPASAVTVIGKVVSNFDGLKKVRDGEEIVIEKVL